MILPRPEDAIHKAWLYRLLINLIDDNKISSQIYFKGGTCAAMLNFLDRFSVDLDFDLKKNADKKRLRQRLRTVFEKLDLQLKYENPRALQFVVKYPQKQGSNTISLDIIDTTIAANSYAPFYLVEIDRYANCQTIETMFAHKLVAVTDRYKKYHSLAGRDIYDIHYFFIHGQRYRKEVIEERTKTKTSKYLSYLSTFIYEKFTQTIIDQDLNILLPLAKFQSIRNLLKREVLMFLKDEIERLIDKTGS